MIRYLDDREKQACRELWEEAFPEDSKEFDDYYFRDKLRDNRILALVGEDEPRKEEKKPGGTGEDLGVDAMIHLNPYSLMVRGFCWQVDYLVGVATRREKRHKGYMRRLLLQMMKDMRQEQMPFCFLMPADEAIYRPFGFTYIYRQKEFVRGEGWEQAKERRQGTWKGRKRQGRNEPQEIMLEAASLGEDGLWKLGRLIPQEESEEYRVRLEEAAQWMDHWLGNHYQVYAKRDMAYLDRLISELSSENGTLDILYHKGKIAAMESWWGRAEREQRLLYGEAPYVKTTDGLGKPAIMARIISPEAFAPVIRLKEKRDCGDSCEILLFIQDPLIEKNQGLWVWHLDRKTSWLEKTKEDKFSPELALTIDELTAWWFGYHIPTAAEPYRQRIDTLRDVFLDEIV